MKKVIVAQCDSYTSNGNDGRGTATFNKRVISDLEQPYYHYERFTYTDHFEYIIPGTIVIHNAETKGIIYEVNKKNDNLEAKIWPLDVKVSKTNALDIMRLMFGYTQKYSKIIVSKTVDSTRKTLVKNTNAYPHWSHIREIGRIHTLNVWILDSEPPFIPDLVCIPLVNTPYIEYNNTVVQSLTDICLSAVDNLLIEE